MTRGRSTRLPSIAFRTPLAVALAWTFVLAIAPAFLTGTAHLAQAEETPDIADSAASAAVNLRPNASYSAASLYNLANSYARAGKPGLAVLNYERASLLAPNDPDIIANLHYVRERAHLPAESKTVWQRAATVASPTLLYYLGVLGVLLLGIALLAGVRYPLQWRKRRAAALVGLVLIGATSGNALVLWPILHAAVVVTPATPVQVSPVPMGDQLFTLPDAETVIILAEHEDFLLVQTKAGRRGWVSRSNLVKVVP